MTESSISGWEQKLEWERRGYYTRPSKSTRKEVLEYLKQKQLKKAAGTYYVCTGVTTMLGVPMSRGKT